MERKISRVQKRCVRCLGDMEPLQNRENTTEGASLSGKHALLHSENGQSITIAEVESFFLLDLISAMQEPVHIGTAQIADLQIHGNDGKLLVTEMVSTDWWF